MALEERFKLQYIRRKSQRIALKTSFNKFTNDKSTPILLDVPVPDEPVPKFVAYNGKRLLPRSTPSNLHSWIQVMNKAQRKRSKKEDGVSKKKKAETKDGKPQELEWYIIGEDGGKETKDDEQHDKNEKKEDDGGDELNEDGGNELNEDEEIVNKERESEDRLYEVSGSGNHLLIPVVSQYEVLQSSTKEDEGESEDVPSEETKTDEDVQIRKSNEEMKIESEEYTTCTQHVGQDNQVLVMCKSIIGDDVGDDDVTTKAPIFDETPHKSKPDEDKSSQSDFTASMMIEYEREEAKILMVSKPTFDETPQNNKPSMEDNPQSNFTASMIVECEQKENDILKDRQQREEDRKKEAEKVEESGQLDFNASMIVEYEKIGNQILIDRQKELDNIKKSSNDDPSFDLHILQQTPYGDNILMGTETDENVSKVITESEFLNTKEEENPQVALQSQEPKEDGKNERPSRYKRMAEVLCSPYLERVVSMGEKRTILENNISSYLFSGYGDEWYD
ncbi:hypothetical protein L1987_64088 [Smallanthus sonchifolius]|uniref:Uncharacterized protein n=1 Tax=Smallanthus sonchifolius TaxID=185202 RepID=A0ACB9CF31_9ASTR|nr:hypothetical protein L1987_64088 [Smallanthus sonchifolius]